MPTDRFHKALSRGHQGRRDGLILIAVLGFVFLIAVFITQFLDLATRQMRMRAIELSRTDLRTTAYSALEVTLAVMAEFQEIDDGLHRPSQGWGNPIDYAELAWPLGVEVRVTIEDETGRIPLEPLDEDLLRTLLDSLEVDYSDIDVMIDSLLDWTDENDSYRLNGAEDDYYQREDPPYLPANGPLTNFDTLAKIRGFKDVLFDEDGVPNELYYRFIAAVSLHNDSKININTAPAEVISALSGDSTVNNDQFFDFMNGLDREPGNSDDEVLRSSDDLSGSGFRGNADSIGFDVAIARVRVEVIAGDKRFNLVALVDTGGGESRDSSGEGDNNSGDDSPPGDDSSGNSGSSGFTLLRLVENANFD